MRSVAAGGQVGNHLQHHFGTITLNTETRSLKTGTPKPGNRMPPPETPRVAREEERELFIDDLLVRIYLIIDMTLVDRPCAMGV